MKVVGLLSGGKDSCFNLCHCAAQGHEIVALASLRPEGGKEEIDSYLYQTVGQDGLHFIAQAFDLPLFRRVIRGTAVDQGGDYASTSKARLDGKVEGDETEDLYALLQDVLAEHPDIQGVSVGAILSNYQRIRVEHVCARLGLQSLAYLWQYDQSQLLEDMAEAGLECIIIKVAGAGLGLRHLGQDVCSEEMRLTLETLKNKWGTHPAGEGGEYETFTVNCPLFKRRIEITDKEQVVLSSSDPRYDLGTVAYLRIKEAQLASKEMEHGERLRHMRIPDLLDQDAQRLLEAFDIEDEPRPEYQTDMMDNSSNTTLSVPELGVGPCVAVSGAWISVGNVTAQAATAQEQVAKCFELVEAHLKTFNVDLTAVTHVNLYLSSMSLFPSVNAVYNTFFGPSPPSRACIACPLQSRCHVKMDIIAYRSTPNHPRSALHVRGLSYWAPANIGPYSQAVRAGERLFIAGQIGLIPATLSLPQPSSFVKEAALSSQHVRRIVKAVQEGTGGGFTGRMESCICWVSGPQNTFPAKRDRARKVWQSWRAGNEGSSKVPFLIAQASELPKGAQIEWQVTWRIDPLKSVDDENSDDDAEAFERQHSIESSTSNATISMNKNAQSSATLLLSPWQQSKSALSISTLQESVSGSLAARVFYVEGSANVQSKWSSSEPVSSVPLISVLREDYDATQAQIGSKPTITFVPVLNLATVDADLIPLAVLALR